MRSRKLWFGEASWPGDKDVASKYALEFSSSDNKLAKPRTSSSVRDLGVSSVKFALSVAYSAVNNFHNDINDPLKAMNLNLWMTDSLSGNQNFSFPQLTVLQFHGHSQLVTNSCVSQSNIATNFTIVDEWT